MSKFYGLKILTQDEAMELTHKSSGMKYENSGRLLI
jgi:hypothetical protein